MIPVQVSVAHALERGERYTGSLDAAALPRLAEFAPVQVQAEIELQRDVARLNRLRGQMSGTLHLECQTCGLGFAWRYRGRMNLVLAASEDEEQSLLQDHEPVRIDDDRLMLHQVIEDEVLLALPMIPRCQACDNARSATASAPEPVEKPGSLAALKNLSLMGVTPARRK